MASLGQNISVMRQVRRINKNLLSMVDQVKGPVEQTLIGQATLLAIEMRGLVPVSADDVPGELRSSIRVEQGHPTPKKAIVIRIKAGGQITRRGVAKGKAGFGYGYDYARAVEFGTENMNARPFFFPVYRARRKDIRAATRKQIRNTVMKVFKK